ncbi:hypothetical protein OIDMADRAFT_49185 [Oidiodendron maius Zn]|uniref:Uncharacterized protein n=1 Tax=Oidiodendron maius (strain Zn) TaxID=913774 RepID=A0A0C3DUC8_OIDMZ|nr:hypothetical protein OIDMADRAFT_49185 [Oidiodendron maius Zn]
MADEGGIVLHAREEEKERAAPGGRWTRIGSAFDARQPRAAARERREIRADTEPEPNSSSVPGRGGEDEWLESHNGREQKVGNRGGEPPRRAEIEPLSKGVSLLWACKALGSRRWVMVREYARGTWQTARKGRKIRRARTVGGYGGANVDPGRPVRQTTKRRVGNWGHVNRGGKRR